MNEEKVEKYHTIFVKEKKPDAKWEHHFDADDKDDAMAEKESLKHNNVKIAIMTVPKDDAQWNKKDVHAYVEGRIAKKLHESGTYPKGEVTKMFEKSKEHRKAYEHHSAMQGKSSSDKDYDQFLHHSALKSMHYDAHKAFDDSRHSHPKNHPVAAFEHEQRGKYIEKKIGEYKAGMNESAYDEPSKAEKLASAMQSVEAQGARSYGDGSWLIEPGSKGYHKDEANRKSILSKHFEKTNPKLSKHYADVAAKHKAALSSGMNESVEDEDLFRVAKTDKSVLSHPKAAVVKGLWGNTPLHIAAKHHVEALNHPMVAKVKNNFGSTPLHYAAENHKEALNHPMAAKVKNKNGNTPLHVVAQHFYEDAMKHPMAKSVVNKKGETPHDIATKHKAALKESTKDNLNHSALQLHLNNLESRIDDFSKKGGIDSVIKRAKIARTHLNKLRRETNTSNGIGKYINHSEKLIKFMQGVHPEPKYPE